VPEERHQDVRRWSSTIVSNLSFGHEPPEKRRLMGEAVGEVNEYVYEEIARHRREQPDDLFTVMLNLPDWTEAEISAAAVNLLLAPGCLSCYCAVG
jgi:cytochrome P450